MPEDHTTKIGRVRYPLKIVKAFSDKFPFSAQKLSDLTPQGNKARDMLEGFHGGWVARGEAEG